MKHRRRSLKLGLKNSRKRGLASRPILNGPRLSSPTGRGPMIRGIKFVADTPPGWNPIHAAPAETDLCICIQDVFGLYPLPFPCRKQKTGWINAKQGVRLDISPLGWKEWQRRHGAKRW